MVLLLWLDLRSVEIRGFTFWTEPDLLYSRDPLVPAAEALYFLDANYLQGPYDLTYR